MQLPHIEQPRVYDHVVQRNPHFPEEHQSLLVQAWDQYASPLGYMGPASAKPICRRSFGLYHVQQYMHAEYSACEPKSMGRPPLDCCATWKCGGPVHELSTGVAVPAFSHWSVEYLHGHCVGQYNGIRALCQSIQYATLMLASFIKLQVCAICNSR